MNSSEIRIGIIAPLAETGELLRMQVGVTGLASVEVEAEQYCAAYGDRPTRRFVEARPDIIIVDMQDPAAAIQALHILHAALPETWLFVSCGANDPQLIIESMRAGAREFLSKPIQPRSLSQALGRFIAEKQRYQGAGGVGKIYGVIPAKGGTGATSLAINLAAALTAAPESRVALIDLNSMAGDAAAYLNLKPEFTVSDALGAAARLDSVLLESYMSRAHDLAVLAGSPKSWSDQMPGVNEVTKMLDVVAQTYTHAVLDLPTTLSPELLQIITEMTAGVILILTPELPVLWHTQRLLRALAPCCAKDKLRLVINRQRKMDDITEREMEKALSHPIFWKLPNDYRAALKAIDSGKPLVRLNRSSLARSYYEMARRLTGIPLRAKRPGLLGLLTWNGRTSHVYD